MKKLNQRIMSLAFVTIMSLSSVAYSATNIFADDASGNSTNQSLVQETSGNQRNALWLTEIYPNDVDRSSDYGNKSDLMEFVEFKNTGDTDIQFNNGYGLYYEYPSGTSNVMKKLVVTDGSGNTDVTIKAGKTVVVWSERKDIGGGPTEADFRAAMNIPADVQVLRCSGQNGFADDNRGFAIKTADGNTVSYFHYTTAVDTADGLAVNLSIPEFGYEMLPWEQLKPTSAGTVLHAQLNGRGDISIPQDITPDGLFITEIRPNDSNRDAQFGSGSNDIMECLEVTNTTDKAINFNEEYELDYVIKEESKKKLPLYTTDHSSTNCIIPAGSTAVLWCDRQNALVQGKDYQKWPTEEEFRAAYGIPDSVPVFVFTDQNGLNNTQRGFELRKINSDHTTTKVSSYFWDGVNDVSDNKSVQLSVNPETPEMLVYAANAATTMGKVEGKQLAYASDDKSAPVLKLLDNTDTINQGNFVRIPYYYAGNDVMPVTSIELYYRTSEMTQYQCVKTTSFAIYNKYYAFIPSDVVLNADYVDYYLKANNAYRSTTTEVRRLSMNKVNAASGLRVNINGATATDTSSVNVSGMIPITAKNFANTSQNISINLDGKEMTATPSLEKGAFYTFRYSGIDSYFKNALTCGNKIIKLMAQCSEIPSDSSMAILVDSSNFTYKADGSATVELVIRPGTYGSTWESDTAANNDDFSINHIALSLMDGTILHPTTFVNENGVSLDDTGSTKMGDSAGCSIAAKAIFDIPADKVDAVAASIDTTQLSEGAHTLTVKSGNETNTVTLNVKNQQEPAPEEQKVDYSADLSINTAADKATASVKTSGNAETVSVYEAKVLDNIHTFEGAGDSTYVAVTESGDGITRSDNGELPYQIYEISADGDETESIRFDIKASSDYGSDVQLYSLNVISNQWEMLDTQKKDGDLTAIFPLKDRIKDGKVTVLAQARGKEYSPYTEEDTKKTVADNYDWDGTKVPEQYDFSMAWMTDTQYYSEQYMKNFDSMTDWIINNRSKMGIQYVIHTGDIVDEFNEEYEYQNASNELKKLEEAKIPYGVLGGNHDVAHGNERYELYKKYFGEDRYKDQSYYGGSYENNLGHYDLVTVEGQEMLFIYMSWDIYTPEIQWINQVLEKYPNRKAILCIHGGINADAQQSYFSDLLLDQVCKTHTNVLAILNGHFHGSALNFVGFDDNGDGINDRTVYQICTDYQSAPEGGEGYIKMIYFDLVNDRIYMNSYSPVLNDINYFDTPKLSSYDAGTIAKNIDITQLGVAFDTTTPKSLTVTDVKAALLTHDELGQGKADGNTSIQLSTQKGVEKTIYAQVKDITGKIISYSSIASYSLKADEIPGDGNVNGNSTLYDNVVNNIAGQNAISTATPSTGDNSRISLLLELLFGSAVLFGLISTILVKNRRLIRIIKKNNRI